MDKYSSRAERPQKRISIKKLVRRSALVLGGFIVVSVIATEAVLLAMFSRSKPVSDKAFPLEDWSRTKGLSWSQEEFAAGENTLYGYCVSGNDPRALVLIAHGLRGSSDGYEPVVKHFAERGYAVFAFDGTASGRSEGDRVVGLQQSRYDLRAAAEFIKRDGRFAGIPLVILGHSAGAYAAASEAEKLDASAVILISGFDRPIDTMRSLARRYTSALADIETPFLLAHEYAALGSEANTSAAEAVRSSDIPALVAHGAKDDAIPLDMSLYKALDTEIGSIGLYLDGTDAHSGHGNILFDKDGRANAELLEAIDAFLEPILPTER